MNDLILEPRDTVVIPPGLNCGYARARDPYLRKIYKAQAELGGLYLHSLANQAAQQQAAMGWPAQQQQMQQPGLGGLGSIVGWPFGHG